MHGYVGQAQKLCGLNADHPVEHAIVLVDQNRVAKTQTADGGRDLANVSRFVAASLTEQ